MAVLLILGAVARLGLRMAVCRVVLAWEQGGMAFFSGIELHQWRQFGDVAIDLSSQTTIITGSNGSGKTTVLNALSNHFGWSLTYVATPRRKKRMQQLWSDVYGDKLSERDENEVPNDQVQVGSIAYDNGATCALTTQRFVSANYNLNYNGMQQVTGLYIPSHRPMAVYNPVTSIPTDPVEAQAHYQQYQQFMLQLYGGGNARNPGSIQKQSLMSFAVFGEGNSAVAANPEYLRIYNDFQEKLRIILPKEIGFRRLEIRSGDVVLVTQSGDFALDAMSGGVNAIFSIAWQISMFGVKDPKTTVIIDEPENHLHPSMQRSILPALARAYPTTKFIVSTHSPFILTSFPEAAVYALFHNHARKVQSQRLESADLSGTPNKVLRDILGVSSNLPIWVEEKVENVLEAAADLSPEEKGKQVMDTLAELRISDAIAEYRGPVRR